MSHRKAVYRAPRLKEWGKIVDLTKAGRTNPGSDVMNGSVNPPGLGTR